MEEENWEETWEEMPEVKQSKKIWGIPLAVFITLIVIVLVAAVITLVYIYQPSTTTFTKNVTVNAPTNNGGGETENRYVSVVANGDISNSLLNCNLDDIGTCITNTGAITLINNDPNNSHNCSIVTNETDGETNVIAEYTGLDTNPVSIAPLSNVTFSINYTSNVSGSYPMQTTISC